jgi:hypothetical protein
VDPVGDVGGAASGLALADAGGRVVVTGGVAVAKFTANGFDTGVAKHLEPFKGRQFMYQSELQYASLLAPDPVPNRPAVFHLEQPNRAINSDCSSGRSSKNEPVWRLGMTSVCPADMGKPSRITTPNWLLSMIRSAGSVQNGQGLE